MAIVLKHIELIEQYCEGKLSAQDKTDFETRLLIDAEFKEEFELYKAIVAGIKEQGEDNLKAKLKLADNELDNVPKIVELKKENKKGIKYWAVAATIIFIIGIGLFWSLSNKSDLPQLADTYYEKEKGLPIEMSVTKNQLADVMNLYKSGDYVATKNKLEFLLKENNANDTLHYFYGVVNYELNNYRASRAGFNSVKTESNYYEKAEYRLILIDLKTNDIQKALDRVNKCLLNKQHLYYDNLVKLKSELTK
ncbi:MAG: hypothetical protein U0W65_17520 [Bacteroidia bacterium]